MEIIQRFAVNNPCYKNAVRIIPRGVMVHSIGVPQPDPLVIVSNFNQSGADTCVCAVVGAGDAAYQILPWDYRAWHSGSGPNGSANSTHISFELTEPSTIRYTSGAAWTDLNPEATRRHVLRTYENGVALTADLCYWYSLDPLEDGVVLSHSEGHARGIASAHADVEHIWNRLGLSMDQFRQDVAARMAGADKNLYIAQAGYFLKRENAAALAGQLFAAGFPSYIRNGLDDMQGYIVQAGAFRVRKNAEIQVKLLKEAGFDAFVRKI